MSIVRKDRANEIARNMLRCADRISAEDYLEKHSFLVDLIVKSFTSAEQDAVSAERLHANWGDDLRQEVYEARKDGAHGEELEALCFYTTRPE